MRTLWTSSLVALLLAATASASGGNDQCRYMKNLKSLVGYESGGPYMLDHFRLTTGRTDLRQFLWQHWHEHKKGFARANARTVDRGTVKVLYVVQPDAQGRWDIEVEIDRPIDPPCSSFHADSLVRVRIANPDQDYPSQTLGIWPEVDIRAKRLADSEVADPKLYRVVLLRNGKIAPDAI